MASLPANSSPKSSCLILHAGALGDCVLTLHVAMAMQQTGYKITMAARSPIAAWAARRGLIDHFIWLDRVNWLLWGATTPVNSGNRAELAKVDIFDRVISFLGGPGEVETTRLKEWFGPDRIIHLDPRPSEKTLREGTHITHQWVEEINRQGLDFKFEISDLRFETPYEPGRAAQSKKLKEPFTTSPHRHVTMWPNIIIHPGSGGLAKCCPLEAMEALVRELLARGWHARWMIGPDEVERDGPEFRRRLERTAPVIFEESVDAAADLVSAADVFIGNDAGMTHVAALADVKTVALFGPTDPRVWRPLGSNCAVYRFPVLDGFESNWLESIGRMIAGNQ